jgi:hypothetical protein
LLTLTTATSTKLELRRTLAATPAVIAGVGFALMAIVPIAVAHSLTRERLLTSAILFAISATLLVRGRPRAESLQVDLVAKTLVTSRSVHDLRNVRHVVLTGHRESSAQSARERYRVELVLADGQRELLLERHEPAGTLRDLSRVLAVWPLHVELGWGLPRGATPWLSAGRSDAGQSPAV